MTVVNFMVEDAGELLLRHTLTGIRHRHLYEFITFSGTNSHRSSLLRELPRVVGYRIDHEEG